MMMQPAEIEAFLAEVHLARVATVRPDGRPHVAPVWYLWRDGNLYFESATSSVKARNLRANPHIAVTVDVYGGGMRYKFVILEGQATLIEDRDTARALAQQIYRRYVGDEGLQTPTVQAMLDAEPVIARLQPAKIIAHNEFLASNLSVV